MRKLLTRLLFLMIPAICIAGTTNPGSNYQWKSGYSIILDSGNIRLTDGEIIMTGDIHLTGILYQDGVGVEEMSSNFATYAGTEIVVADRVVLINPEGATAVTSTSDPLISTSSHVNGTIVTLYNVSASSSIKIQDNATQSGSQLDLGDYDAITLEQYECVTLQLKDDMWSLVSLGNAEPDDITCNDDLTVGDDLTVTGDATITGDITISGNGFTLGSGSMTFVSNTIAISTNVDMETHIISNIGAAGTDFDGNGGLTLAGDLGVDGGDIDFGNANRKISDDSTNYEIDVSSQVNFGNNIIKGFRLDYQTITDSATITTSSATFITLNKATQLNITLPDAAGNSGLTYIFKNIGAGIVSISGLAGDTIDGDSTTNTQMDAQWDEMSLTSNGTGWLIWSEKEH